MHRRKKEKTNHKVGVNLTRDWLFCVRESVQGKMAMRVVFYNNCVGNIFTQMYNER